MGSLNDRFEVVRPLLVGSSVLDVGCASRYGNLDWLHGRIAAEFSDQVGIDINEATIDELQGQGYDVQVADAQHFDLGRTFDVVFAGELVEHLDDFHGFLQCARRHLTPGGRLILTTPNSFYVGNFVYRWVDTGRSIRSTHVGSVRTHPNVARPQRILPSGDLFTGHKSPTRSRKAATFVVRHTFPPRLALDTIVVVASVE